jgi:aryl-alcohol dehydrogenase-like predicted oxidoreductase
MSSTLSRYSFPSPVKKALHVAEKHGWTRFVSMQDHLNLIYREEEREMLPLCREEKIGVIPYSPLASGRLTRDWSRGHRSGSSVILRGLVQAPHQFLPERRGAPHLTRCGGSPGVLKA